MTLDVVSLFSGCGGADLGIIGGFNFLRRNYRAHNTRIIHASDFDAKAVASYNLNFSHPARVLDVRDLNLDGTEADLLIGGFPCQSFSTVNPTKDPTDSRGQLYLEMARVIQQVKPRVFIAENVVGFARLGGGKYLNAAVAEFESCGYVVQYQILNAADYGIPQLRKRLFIVGVRSNIKQTFQFPEPTHGEAGELRSYVPLSRVIENLEPRDPKYFFSQRAVAGVKRAKKNMKRALAQDLKKPCLTITSHLAKVSLNSRDPVLLVDSRRELYRRFTPREAASIQSFPKSFKFAGSDADAYRQIGNAIPPVLMWHLMDAISRCLSSSSQSSAA